MSGVKIGLLVGGAVFELVGIVVLVFPDLVPYGVRFSQWQRKHTRFLLDHIRRMLGRPRNVGIGVVATSVLNVEGRASLMKSASAAAPLEEKVEFLLTRDLEAQRDINILRERVENVQAELSKRLDESRREIEARFGQELKTALEVYRPIRIWGTAALVLGLVCVTFANFID